GVIPRLVSRFRSSHPCAAHSFANFGIKGTLAIYDSSAVFGFEVPTQTRGYNYRNFKSTALVPWFTLAGVSCIGCGHARGAPPDIFGRPCARSGRSAVFGFHGTILHQLRSPMKATSPAREEIKCAICWKRRF